MLTKTGRIRAIVDFVMVITVAALVAPGTVQASPSAFSDCPTGNVCFWTGDNGTGSRCTWSVDDPDWQGGSIRCSWAATTPAQSVYNHGNSGRPVRITPAPTMAAAALAALRSTAREISRVTRATAISSGPISGNADNAEHTLAGMAVTGHARHGACSWSTPFRGTWPNRKRRPRPARTSPRRMARGRRGRRDPSRGAAAVPRAAR